jgi:hypothetical protein
MQAIFDSALANPHMTELRDAHANILVLDGNFVTSQGRDLNKARGLMAEAAALEPAEPQYRMNLVTMDISMSDRTLAERDLDGLRRLNYLGHLDEQITSFEVEIAALPPPAGVPPGAR